jgi:hypothetical protein
MVIYIYITVKFSAHDDQRNTMVNEASQQDSRSICRID